MPLTIGYSGDSITPTDGRIIPILNPSVLVIPPQSLTRIDTGQAIYLPYRSICVIHACTKILYSRGLIIFGDLLQGPDSADADKEREHKIIVTGFNPHEYDVNLVPGDVLCHLVFSFTSPVRMIRRKMEVRIHDLERYK